MVKELDLLGEDYYSIESAREFFSISQYKRFLDCQARALAELQGKWSEKQDKTALLVGNYVHSYFESKESHEKFLQENSGQILAKTGRTKGQPKAEYKNADKMIKALDDDEQFKSFYIGDKEVSLSGEIEGVPFKGKIDCLNLERGYFVDIKTTRLAIDECVWDQELDGKVRWFESYGYVLQMAAYQELIYQVYGVECSPIIYAVTKDDIPDTRAIFFKTQERLDSALAELRAIINHLDKVKRGEIEPTPCKQCEYCRFKKLTDRLEIY